MERTRHGADPSSGTPDSDRHEGSVVQPGEWNVVKLPSSNISPGHLLLIVATLAGGLAVDVRTNIVGQSVLGIGAWAVLFGLLSRIEQPVRTGLILCLAIATAGELFLSLVWGLYTYRLANIPLFVPPGHVLLLLLGLWLAERLPESVAGWIIGSAGLYSLAAAFAGLDTLGVALFAVLAVASLAMPAQRRLFASTLVLALALELYGTWLGNWRWATEIPGLSLVTTNPPGVAGAFYCALDALVAAASLQVVPRFVEWTARTKAGMRAA